MTALYLKLLMALILSPQPYDQRNLLIAGPLISMNYLDPNSNAQVIASVNVDISFDSPFNLNALI